MEFTRLHKMQQLVCAMCMPTMLFYPKISSDPRIKCAIASSECRICWAACVSISFGYLHIHSIHYEYVLYIVHVLYIYLPWYRRYALSTLFFLCMAPKTFWRRCRRVSVCIVVVAVSDAIEPKTNVYVSNVCFCVCVRALFCRSLFPTPIAFQQSLSLSYFVLPYFHYCFVYVVFECFRPTRVRLQSLMCQYNIQTTDWHQPNEIRRRYYYYCCCCILFVRNIECVPTNI